MLRRLVAREARQRPGRALLTLLSIVIGVAAFVAVNLTAGATRRSYEDMYRRLAGRAALEVVAQGHRRFEQSLADRLEKLPGIEAAVPTIENYTVLYLPGGKSRLLVMGIDPARDRLVREYRLTAGEFFPHGDGALLEEGFAKAAGLKVSDEVKILASRGRPERVTVVGLLSPRGMAGFSQGSVIFLPLDLAQELFANPGEVDTISLVLDDGAEEATVRQAVEKALPPGLTVRTPMARAQLGRNAFENAERGLQFGCALMVALAIFIVLNTFLMNLGERQKRFAILRAIGATRRQVWQLLIVEALAMGLLGALLGCLLGLAGAHLLLQAMAQLAVSEPAPLRPTVWPFLLAIALGMGVALVATYFPARQASRISPMEALRAAAPRDHGRISWLTTLGGAALFGGSGFVVGACILGWLPIVLSIPAGVAFLSAFSLVIPALLWPLGRVITAIIRPVVGVEGHLAEQQLIRRRARAGLTIGVLYIAIGAGVGLGTTILNNVEDVRNWHRRAMQGDFLVRAEFLDPVSREAVQMPNAMRDEIRALPGVTAVEPIRYFGAQLGDQPVVVIARDFRDRQRFPLVLATGDQEAIRSSLLSGDVVLSTVIAQRTGLKGGDSVEIATPAETQKLRIAGRMVDYTLGGDVVSMDLAVAQRLFHVQGADIYLVRVRPEARGSVESQLNAYSKKAGLMVHSFADLSRLLDGVMAGILRGLWGLLALGFIVAGFGIGNTLMMNVLEQTREIAMLRVIGMTRWQVRKMILAQAVVIGIIGLGLGIIAGVNTAYIMSLCMEPLLGYTVTFAIPLSLVLGSFFLALLVVLAAAWLPAGRAAKLNLLIALQYE